MFKVPVSKLGRDVAGEEREGVRVGEGVIQDILFWGHLPIFLTSTQAFHEQVVLDILGGVMNSLGDLIKDLKLPNRNIYVDTLTTIFKQL